MINEWDVDLCLYDKSKNVLVTDMLHSMGLSLNLNFYVCDVHMTPPILSHETFTLVSFILYHEKILRSNTRKYYARTQVHWDNTKVTGRPRQQERNRITELEEALKTSESMLESDGMECEASEVGYRFLEKKSDNNTTMPPPVRAMLCEEAKNDCGSLQNIISFDSFRCPICTCSH